MMLEFQVAKARPEELPLHLVEEINHRVANEYAEAIADLSLAARRAIPGELRQALRQAADRLQAHAETHRALLPPTAGHVNLADYVGRLCAAFAHSALAERSVRLSVKTEEVWLTSDRAWRLGLAVAELVRNAARHGLRGRPGSIAVQVAHRAGEVLCRVSDDGRIGASARPGRGVGLVQALAVELGGSADWWFTQDGCVAQLRAPVELLTT